MKNFFQSMTGRVFAILVVGVLASASLTWWLANNERQRAITQLREVRVVDQAEQFLSTLDAIPAAGRPAFIQTSMRFGVKAQALKVLPASDQTALPESGFAKALHDRLGKDFPMVLLPGAQAQCLNELAASRDQNIAMVRGICETLAVTLRDGSTVRITLLPRRLPLPAQSPESLAYLAVFLISIAALVLFVARMTTHPLKKMAQAAAELGENIDREPMPEQGATEIRQAAVAFNAMQARIRDHIRQRTQMLAAITHDLQTPLTRLRLRLEKVSDPDLRAKLIQDLAHTQTIVKEGLELARSVDASEPLQELDLDSLLASACADANDAGQQVTIDGRIGIAIKARPTALRRCLTNLIDNAVKYGRYANIRAELSRAGNTMQVVIRVRDGGPGIPADQLSLALEPFYRVETSRSRQTGGTGLGLAIAHNIARQHGGELKLANHPEGGLEATLILPVGAT
jgi:signal transduction histidine kinase